MPEPEDSPAPVLTVRPGAYFTWEQHHPGGCRCVCIFYHPGLDDESKTCMAAAEPGLLIRVEADGRTEGPLPVCRSCYASLTAHTNDDVVRRPEDE